MHDCLRILKLLSRVSPLEAVYLGIDNLHLMAGRVMLCDPFLSRARLVGEMQKARQKREASASGSESHDRLKLWQLQNLYFIALLAARLMTLKMETDPQKILRERRIEGSGLRPILS